MTGNNNDRAAETRAKSWEAKARRDLLRSKVWGMLLAILLLAVGQEAAAFLLVGFLIVAALQGIEDRLTDLWVQNNSKKEEK